MSKNSKRIPPALKHGIYSDLVCCRRKVGPNSAASKNNGSLTSTSAVRWRRISATRLFVWSGA
jgi:hypothetical protein